MRARKFALLLAGNGGMPMGILELLFMRRGNWLAGYADKGAALLAGEWNGVILRHS